MSIQPQAGIEAIEQADIVIILGWDSLNHVPNVELVKALKQAHQKDILIMGLCYGAYPLAYAGLLNHKKAATHWLAEQDFKQKFPCVNLDQDALYVEDTGVITSAGTGAALDCCLYVIRAFYNAKIANAISRQMVIPPHREGGQAQFIEQPVALSTYDSEMNQLLDYLRSHLAKPHSVESIAERIRMNRRTLTRHFKNATGMSLMQWLNQGRIKYVAELLEGTELSIEKIAELSGFNSTVLLRKTFRKKYATSPSQWRKSFGTREF